MTAPIEVDVASLGPLRQIGSGGQGKVFALVNAPDGGVYKEYSPRVVDDLDIDALRRFVQFGRSLTDTGRDALLARVAWPQVIVRRDGVVRGFLMPRIPPRFTVPMRFGDEVTLENALVQYLLNPAAYLTERGLRLTDRFRLEFLRDTADTLALFHKLGIAVGDLSPNNLLFSLIGRPRCFFIDCDAMRLAGESVLAQTETPDWQISAVSEEELGTAASDAYKFGLLVVRLFAADQQARDPAVVPVRLRDLVTSSLSADPDKRAAPTAWLRPLDRLINREPEFRPEPLLPRENPEEAEESAAEPVRAAPVVPPAPPPRPRRWAWVGAVPIVVGVILGIINGGSSNGTTTLTPALPMLNYPLTTERYPELNYPLTTEPYPNLTSPLLLSPNFDITCILRSAPRPDVHGGLGLSQANSVVGSLVCEVNKAARGGASGTDQVWQPLRDKAPYDDAVVIGFFGEGTASPRVTVEWTDHDRGCWVNTIHFTASYEVSSVGPLSPCG